jgi:DNA primase small subunit
MDDIDLDILKYIEEEEEKEKIVSSNKQKANPEQEHEQEAEISENDMKEYYLKLFPYELYFKWLGNNDTSYFERREFSFTKRGDIYIRFLSYRDDKDLKNDILKANPIKIDVGAVYNTLPK